MPTPYDQARIAARSVLGRLSIEQARAIQTALNQFMIRITEAVKASGGAAGLVQLHRIVQRETDLLAKTLERSIAARRDIAFKEIEKIWQAAGIEYSRSRGVTGSQLAQIRTPPITLLGAFETMSPAGTWKTLLRIYAGEAAAEVNAIVRNAIASQIDPDELAIRLRKYVIGSEPFHSAFKQVPTLAGDQAKIDLGSIPAAQRGAAREMVFNAERIAFSELHNARSEAEVSHMVNDPYIEAVRWTLSPNRGSGTRPDECDFLAKADFYGLGPGVYPVANVPSPPHPFDRCEKIPVTRPTAEIDQPKPQPGLQVDPMRAHFPGSDSLSQMQEIRARESASQAINNAALAGQR